MTAAPRPQASGYDDAVDLGRYPINDPESPRRTGPSSGRARTSCVTGESPS